MLPMQRADGALPHERLQFGLAPRQGLAHFVLRLDRHACVFGAVLDEDRLAARLVAYAVLTTATLSLSVPACGSTPRQSTSVVRSARQTGSFTTSGRSRTRCPPASFARSGHGVSPRDGRPVGGVARTTLIERELAMETGGDAAV